MNRQTVVVPRCLMLATSCNWDIDWGAKSGGEDTARGDQVVVAGLPRWFGSPRVALPRRVIGHWRALRWQVSGQVNVWSVPMVDDVSYEQRSGTWESDWDAYQRGQYIEPRPRVTCVNAVAAGADSLVIDERSVDEPVRVGAVLSANDWPFAVVDRAGSGSSVTLQVRRLARPIAAGAQIDLYARGLFVAAAAEMGNPAYGLARRADVDLSFVEWITRP